MGPIRKKGLTKAEQDQGAQPLRLSRTQKKKTALLLQDLGERLVKLTDDQLEQIGLAENVLQAVKLAKTIKKHGPLDRQMQYIGSLMRKYDPAPVQEFLDALDRGKAPPNRNI